MITIYLNKNGAHTPKTEEIIKETLLTTNSNFICFFTSRPYDDFINKNEKNIMFLSPTEAKEVLQFVKNLPEKSTIFFSIPSILSVDEASSVFEPMIGSNNTVKLFNLIIEKKIDLHFFARNVGMEAHYLADKVINIETNEVIKNRHGMTTKDENKMQERISQHDSSSRNVNVFRPSSRMFDIKNYK